MVGKGPRTFMEQCTSCFLFLPTSATARLKILFKCVTRLGVTCVLSGFGVCGTACWKQEWRASAPPSLSLCTRRHLVPPPPPPSWCQRQRSSACSWTRVTRESAMSCQSVFASRGNFWDFFVTCFLRSCVCLSVSLFVLSVSLSVCPSGTRVSLPVAVESRS